MNERWFVYTIVTLCFGIEISNLSEISFADDSRDRLSEEDIEDLRQVDSLGRLRGLDPGSLSNNEIWYAPNPCPKWAPDGDADVSGEANDGSQRNLDGDTVSSDYDGTLKDFICEPAPCPKKTCEKLKQAQDGGKTICQGSSRAGGFPKKSDGSLDVPESCAGVNFTPAGQGGCPDTRDRPGNEPRGPGVERKMHRMCNTSNAGDVTLVDNKCGGQTLNCGNGTTISCKPPPCNE